MKKMITICLTIILTLCVFPCDCVMAASIKVKAGKEYAKIIQTYLNAYSLASQNRYNDYDSIDYGVVNAEFVASAQSNTDGAIYRIMDYNKDGTPELFIGLNVSNSDYNIYDVYTLKNRKAVHLMEGIGYRAGTCIFCKNRIIKDYWFGSFDRNGVIFHKMSPKKKKLDDLISLTYDGSNGRDTYTKTVNNKTSKITKSKYENLIKKYDKPISMMFYKADIKAVKKIRKGKFTYSNQEKWRLG